ncbi:hypothetical protein AA309_12045 [Microvirga vignae]|uniref:Ribbon-helix-helix protein CopG domain-containing protein n=1 Tax=Microvirga vignae TaxID=1225564 RepID=A0A0H1RCD0_9HYPH|nr:hypothetical protein [Microvirga vignae]KLK92850.1 hypothetical protein AA309_12045 [Microvirga vignae]
MFFDLFAENGTLWRDILRFRAPPGFRERIQAAAFEEGTCMSEFIRRAATERAERIEKEIAKDPFVIRSLIVATNEGAL